MAEPEASDVAGTGEQDFKEGMQRAADDHDDADKDIDNKLDFAEFCDLVRGREEGDIPEDELKTRFELLDADGTGKIEMSEYLLWSLKDCLARASQRIIDLFKAWDEDNSGTVDSAEFYKAVKALGFAVDREDTDAVFKALDTDKSGSVDYRELNERLRAGIGSELAKRNLKRAPPKPDRSRTAKLNAKNVNMNYTTSRIAVLPATVKLDASSGEPIQVQLKNILTESGAKLVDLFTEWDTDGNGGLDKKEWRQGIAALGYDAPQADIDAGALRPSLAERMGDACPHACAGHARSCALMRSPVLLVLLLSARRRLAASLVRSLRRHQRQQRRLHRVLGAQGGPLGGARRARKKGGGAQAAEDARVGRGGHGRAGVRRGHAACC